MHLSDEFSKKANSICFTTNQYGSYELLNFAELACENDAECIGIYDDHCDRKGPFQLCKYGIFEQDSYTPSCIYQKKEYNGICFQCCSSLIL